MDKEMTMPQLIEFLETAFLKRDFEEVQNILVHRDTQLNKKIQELTDENELLSEKLAVEELKVASLQDDLSKQHQQQCVLEGERNAIESELELLKMRFRELDGKEKLNKLNAEAEVNIDAVPAGDDVKDVSLPKGQGNPPRKRKPCYGWISDGDEDDDFVELTPAPLPHHITKLLEGLPMKRSPDRKSSDGCQEDERSS